MSRLLTPEEAELLRDSEMRHAVTFAVAVTFVTLGAAIVGIGTTVIVMPDLAWLVTLGIFGVGGAIIMLALILAFRQGRQHIRDVVDMTWDWVRAEIKAKDVTLPAPTAPTLPATPSEGEGMAQQDGRAGWNSRLLHGLPVLTLEYVCNYLADKNSWAEARLATMPVPYVYPPARFGKAEAGTIYDQLFHTERGIFCRAGIIVGRGGAGNAMGKLTTLNAVEMMERLKELPETA